MDISYERNLVDNSHDLSAGYVAFKIKEVLSKDCRIKAAGESFIVTFEADLTSEEQTTLDGIIEDSRGEVVEKAQGRKEIIDNIINSVTSDEQLHRLIAALDKYPTFGYALDDHRYNLAKSRADEALANNDITQDDYDMVISHIPFL